MKHTYILFALLCCVFLLPSCRKDAPELMNPNEAQLYKTPSQLFEVFWHGMDTSYGFWDIDPTDWDKVYDDYLPLFRELDKCNPSSEEEEEAYYGRMRELFTEMCRNLIDHHLGINFHLGEYEFWVIPGKDQIMSRDYFHNPIIDEVYEGCISMNKKAGRIEEYQDGSYNNGSINMVAVSYKIDGVIYLYFSSFSFTNACFHDPEGSVAKVLMNYQRMIMETSDIKGVIIDVRDNGGGSLADMQQILAPLIDTDLLIGYTRSKDGLGRLDYGPWVPGILSPAKIHRKVEAPIVMLVNLHSVSMSEITSMAVSALPNGCIIGERTFGGTGPLMGNYRFAYSGATNNIVDIHCATSMMKDAKGVIHESIGLKPDIEVLQDAETEAAMRNGVDPQLERALEYIRTGK